MPEIVCETTNVTPHDFKATMGRFASGVTVVTTRLGGLRAAITVNSFCSVSLEPPLVLICIDRASRVHDVLVQAGIFAANLLTAEQEAISRCFAGHSRERWEEFCGCATHVVATGAPIFDESLGFVDCHIVDVFPGGDHSILVGRVEALGASAGEPLLYYRGRYDPPRRPARAPGGRIPGPRRVGEPTTPATAGSNGRTAEVSALDSTSSAPAPKTTPARAARKETGSGRARPKRTAGDAPQGVSGSSATGSSATGSSLSNASGARSTRAGGAPERSEG